MKSGMIALTIAGAIGHACMAQLPARTTATPAAAGRMVRVEGIVNAPISQVWRVFTTSEGAEEFFAQKANIGLAIGGRRMECLLASELRNGSTDG
jgi:hypothetical protein